MTKIIQPLSDPDDIRGEASEQEKEKFTDYYVDAPAPDPLSFQQPSAQAPATTLVPEPASNDPVAAEAALDQSNDPLNYQPAQPSNAQAEAYNTEQANELSQSNDPLKNT